VKRTDQINITFPDRTLLIRIDAMCELTGVSRSRLIRRAVAAYLDSLGAPAPTPPPPAPTPPAAAKHDDESYGW
jgi:Ribbon-helix-helix protein, copG family